MPEYEFSPTRFFIYSGIFYVVLSLVKNYGNPANSYMFKVNKNSRKSCEICSKLLIKTPERHQ